MSLVAPFPALLLAHVGAKSGILRSTTLVYFTDADRVIVIASNLGRPHRPGWYHNVMVNPEVTLLGLGFSGRFRAEEIVGTERDRLFQVATEAPSLYGHYQQSAGKALPVIAFHEVQY